MEDIRAYQLTQLRKDFVAYFGDKHDGTIQIPVLTKDGVIETSYFYGDDKPKNIITISSQVGCPARCSFCELGAEKFSRDLSSREMYEQVVLLLQTASQSGIDINTTKHKVTVANTGEPLFNVYLVTSLEEIANLDISSFKVSTIFPAGNKPRRNIESLTHFAARHPAQPLQLQISLISTSEQYRREAGGIKLASFEEIREAAEYWRGFNRGGRKINLSLILSDQTPCDVNEVYEIFPPELFRFRFRNYVTTENGKRNLLSVIDPGKMEQIKESFTEKGYEVGDWATPTAIEQKFGLAANVTRRRYLQMVKKEI